MYQLRYCLAEEIRRQDLQRNVAQYRLVKQARQNDSSAILGTGALPRPSHNVLKDAVRGQAGRVTTSGRI
jgi:hypothetical protein